MGLHVLSLLFKPELSGLYLKKGLVLLTFFFRLLFFSEIFFPMFWIFLYGFFFFRDSSLPFACSGVWIWSWRSCGLLFAFFRAVQYVGELKITCGYLQQKKNNFHGGKQYSTKQTITSHAQYIMKCFIHFD